MTFKFYYKMKFHFKITTLFLAMFFLSINVFGQVAMNKTHKVKTNETLFSIAQEYNVSVRDLKKWNHLKNNTISIGQELIVAPPVSQLNKEKKMHAQTSENTSFLSSGNKGQAFYKVKSGDSLYKIAQQFNMTLGELKRLNHLKSNALRVGQRLRVKAQISAPSIASGKEDLTSTAQGKFVEYKVHKTEKISDLLKTFKMDDYEFSALNPDVSGSKLYRGQTVTVLLPATVNHKNPYRINADMKSIEETNAVEYPDSDTGRPTTSGSLYNPEALTAASSTLPLGSVMYIENPVNKRGFFVLINDRITNGSIKLSKKAYTELGLTSQSHSVQISEVQ